MTVAKAAAIYAWTWLQTAAELWRRWRDGIPDDQQEGLELGTFRANSCPTLSKYPSAERDISPTKSDADVYCRTETKHSRIDSTAQDKEPSEVPCYLNAEYSKPQLKTDNKNGTTAVHITAQIPETPRVEDSMSFQYLVRLANGVLSETYRFRENLEHVRLMCSDGVVPCLLANSLIMPDMVDVRALNVPNGDEDISLSERCQNHILCLNSLASVSQSRQSHTPLKPEELARGDGNACLELLWRIIDLATIDRVNVHRFPVLRALQEEDEDIFHFLQLTPTQLLLRWVNFMFSQSTSETPRAVDNINSDFNNADAFLQLQQFLNPDILIHQSADTVEERAEAVITNCDTLAIATTHSVKDVLSGDEHLNGILLSQFFCSYPCLALGSDSDEFDTEVEDFDDEGSREERTFRMWLNSLGCDTLCANLFSPDFRSGWMLLEVLESIAPKTINWSKANKPPFKPIVARIKSVENCDQVIRVAKEVLNLSLVGIGGADIADGKRKPILALVWQLLRLHTLMILDSALEMTSPNRLSVTTPRMDSARKVNEVDVLAWANHMLDFSGSHYRITSFKDPELSNSLALLDLLKSIEPHAIQERFITPGLTSEEKEMNAKYVLSVARKLGATIFIIWEDITEVKPKMLLLLIASFMLLDKQLRKQHKAVTLHHRLLRSPSATPRSVGNGIDTLVS